MKYLIFSTFISLATVGFCQDHGFFGKKNIISFNATGAVPLLNIIATRNFENFELYRNSSGNLFSTDNFLDGGFNASFIHGFSNSFGFGVEYAMNFSNCAGPRTVRYPNEFGSTNFLEIQHEMLDLTTMTFMPKIEFTTNSSIISVGLHSSFGIGYSLTSVKERPYLSKPVDLFDDTYAVYDQNKVFNQKDNYHSLTIMYGLTARIPVTKNLLFQCGVRYSLNLNVNVIPDGMFNNTTGPTFGYYTSKQEIATHIAQHRALSLVTGNIGFAFLF